MGKTVRIGFTRAVSLILVLSLHLLLSAGSWHTHLPGVDRSPTADLDCALRHAGAAARQPGLVGDLTEPHGGLLVPTPCSVCAWLRAGKDLPGQAAPSQRAVCLPEGLSLPPASPVLGALLVLPESRAPPSC